MFKKIEFLKSVYNVKDLPPPEFPEIAFLGRSNVGKSSLINALLFEGKEVLPKAATPMTAALSIIEYSDEFKAEVEFYSKDDLKILEEKGADDFMSKFYVGYGHKSIGDCGSCTIFIEGVSMLAAKAIQDSKLYNGQEASTRYIDFSNQKMINISRKNE